MVLQGLLHLKDFPCGALIESIVTSNIPTDGATGPTVTSKIPTDGATGSIVTSKIPLVLRQGHLISKIPTDGAAGSFVISEIPTEGATGSINCHLRDFHQCCDSAYNHFRDSFYISSCALV